MGHSMILAVRHDRITKIVLVHQASPPQLLTTLIFEIVV
jgi:hypothetical protein